MDIKVAARASYWYGRLNQRLYQSDSILARIKLLMKKYFPNFNLSRIIIQIFFSIGMCLAAIILSHSVNQVPNIASLGMLWAEIVTLIIGISCIVMGVGLIFVIYRHTKGESSSTRSRQWHGLFLISSRITVKFLFLGLVGFTLSIFLFAALDQTSSVVLLSEIWRQHLSLILRLILMLTVMTLLQIRDRTSEEDSHR